MMLDQIVATREQQPVPESIDPQTISACQQGDRKALRVLFEKYNDRVYSIALYSLSGDEAAAADVTQQVFLKLMTRINQFRGDSEFATWLYRLVINTCHDEHRKRRRFVGLTEFFLKPAAVSESPRARYARRELSDRVQSAIVELKPKLRWPILLKYVEGMSYDEIATVLSCSKGTVASRLNRAHKTLARRLSYLKDQI
ncbi:MAG TPA: sigma-70 family RNA polymerase sigma factor [Pyrinomonadaceae bacterium]|jgi:RNA polymerase sigma-70 factor (ECF subfamily)|nr:sigma-70 family RNA polymerase sigma factor [Pyrinomonadaceae bacterium]